MRKLMAILLFCISFSAYASTPPHYAIIIDAGSNGSRLHLFEYSDNKPLPIISDIFSENISPGLSSFANEPNAAGESLKKLFDDATEKLTTLHTDPATVTVDIYGTAGMRLLAPQTQEAIYNNIHDFLQQHYTFAIHRIETIPGKMEGIYGWLDVNYLTKRFDANTDITVGAIDMGGASTEIAFSTTDSSKPNDEATLNIAGKTYTVFAKSFLRGGQDQARETMNAGTNVASCYPVNYTFAPNSIGNYNYQICANNYTPVINQFYQQGDLLDVTTKEFIAYSGIYYTLHFLEADSDPSQANIVSRIQTVCSKSWEQLKKDYPTVADKYLATYCANAAYQVNLLYSTYHIEDGLLRVQSKVGDKDIDWTLGALLYQLL